MYIDILVQDVIMVSSNKTKHLDNLIDFTLFAASAIIIATYNSSNYKGGERMEDEMNNGEIIKISIEEFSRVQDWMLIVKDKEKTVYNLMYKRYIELKAILSSLGVNLADIDKIKE